MATTDRADATASAVLIIGSGAGLFAAFCPSWFTVRSPFFHEQDARAGNVRAIRQGEAVAAVLTLGMGWAASALTRSIVPLAGAAAVTGAMVTGYEYSMRHPATEDNDAAHDVGPIGTWRTVEQPMRSL